MINFIVALTMSTKTGFAQKLARWAGKVSFGPGEPETLSTPPTLLETAVYHRSPYATRYQLKPKV